MTNQGDTSLVDRLAKLWLAWFCFYMLTGAIAMAQHRTGFFADTVDHVEWLWVKLVILNIPLQIVLALTAGLLDKSSKTGTRKVGNTIAVLNTVLIVMHIVVSIAVHFTR